MRSLTDIDRRYPDLVPCLVILLLTVGFFFPVLFLGKAPAINSLKKVEPWRSVAIENGEGTREYNTSGVPEYTWNEAEGFADDLNRQFIPWGLYAQERLRSGGWPLWNPHLACGQPLYANHQAGLTNPLVLLCYYLFPGMSAFTAIFFLIFAFAGLGMYAYIRILGLGRWPALLSAVTYQFILGYIPVLDTLIVEKALFPFLLYSVERLVRAPAGKGGWWALLSVVFLALVQTSCHVQEAVFISYLIGPYILFAAGGPDAFCKGKVWSTIGGRFLLALGIYIPALILGLVQNLPTWEFYRLSTRSVGFEEQVVSATELESNLSWIQSLMIAYPRLFGDYLKQNMPLEHYLLNYGYVGIVTLIAGIFSGWVGTTRRQVWFWRITALIFFISLIWNWFYFVVLCSLPLFRVSLQKPFSPLFFSLIVLAANGFAFLLDPKPKDSSGNRHFGYGSIFITATAIGLGGLYLYSIILPEQLFTSEQSYAFGQMAIGAVYGAIAFFIASIFWRHVNTARTDAERQKKKNRGIALAAFALLAVILIDLWPVKAHFNPFVDADRLYHRTETTDLLQSRLAWEPGDPDGPYRFGRSWKEILPPNTGMVYGLDDMGGYDSNLVGRYAELLTAVDPSLLVGVHYIESPRYRESFENPLWNMLGVKYVLAHRGHLGQFEPSEQWRHVYLGEVLLMENRNALPRVHIVDNVQYARHDTQALLIARNLDPAIEAVVIREDGPPDETDSTDTDSTPGTAVITEYKPERVTVSATCDHRSLLCFYDTWYPGWTVTVDGERAELECVNYAFKGVFIDAGEHEVVFAYRPQSLLFGILGSIAGLIIILLLMKSLSLLSGRRVIIS